MTDDNQGDPRDGQPSGVATSDLEEHYRRLERMYLGAPCNEYFRPSVRIDRGTAEVDIEVRPDFHHAAGAVHGATLFKTLDDSAFFAASSLVPDVFVLTGGFQLHFLRPVVAGTLRARAEVDHRSRRLLVVDAVVRNDEGKGLARGAGSFMPGPTALTPELGYA